MNKWLMLNLILAMSFCFYSLGKVLFKERNKILWGRDCLMALPLLMAIPLALDFLPSPEIAPIIKKSMVEIDNGMRSLNLRPVIMPFYKKISTVSNETPWYFTFEALFLFNILIGGLFLIIGMIKLYKLSSTFIPIKKYKAIDVLVSERISIPLSFYIPHRFKVVLPFSFLTQASKFDIALKHELQHHRQRDTTYLYFIEILRILFFLNPFTHFWIKLWHEYREMKCDNGLIRRNINPRDYGNVLLDVAINHSGTTPQGVMAMASQTQLKRRFTMMYDKKTTKDGWLRPVLMGLLVFASWSTVRAVDHFVPGQKLSLEEVEQFLEETETEIDLEANEHVKKWLNFYLNDPRGRAFIVKAKERMAHHKETVLLQLKKREMPLELLGVPLIESGYSNKAISGSGAAGIWQFMPRTARRYGLIVNKKKDQRYNVDLATKAAIDYYNHLRQIPEFKGDWLLALLAYNSGEGRLKREIKKRGTRDPWKFLNVGDKEYLAKIVAGMILLKMPKTSFFKTPLPFGRLTSKFGMRYSKPRKGNVFHPGIDFAEKLGAPILSPYDATVEQVTERFKGVKGYGKTVVLNFGGGMKGIFAHLNEFKVEVGQKVKSGDLIGTVGNTGISSGPHLHFELRINDEAVNPEIFL